LTQVFDRPVHCRLFFEQVIRENLGCPQEVRLIFNRTVTRKHTGAIPRSHRRPGRHPILGQGPPAVRAPSKSPGKLVA
jgi:hypothetical protein